MNILLASASTGGFFTGLGIAVGSWLIPLFLGVLTIFGMIYISSLRKDQIGYAKSALTILKLAIGNRLGEKAQAVIDAWLNGIKRIEDGELSVDDGIDEFVEFIVIAAKSNNVTLTESELAFIKEIITQTLESIAIDKKPVQQAVKMMMVENQ